MNGLKFIRIQCNLSLNKVAVALNVSRQIVSKWENGEKNIPQNRIKQLSKYFGIDEKYFGEIDELQKSEILGTAMYRWHQDNEEFFLYRPDAQSKDYYNGRCTYEAKERKKLLSEEVKEKRYLKEEMVNLISEQIEGLPTYTLHDQITSINRGVSYYKYCAGSYKKIYEQPYSHKMSYYFRAIEVLKALSLALGIELETIVEQDNHFFDQDDYTYRVDNKFVQECADLIKMHMNPIIDKLDEMDRQVQMRKDSQKNKN